MNKKTNVLIGLIAIIVVAGLFYQQGVFTQPTKWVAPIVSTSTFPKADDAPKGEVSTPAVAVMVTPVSVPSTQAAKDLFALTNAVRQVPLKYDSTLESLAQQRATYLCTHAFSHDGYRMFIDQSSYSYVGENLARGFTDIQSMFDGFMASPTHKSNILNAHYTHIGIAEVCGVTVVFFGGKSN